VIDEVVTRVTGVMVDNHQDVIKYLKKKDIRRLYLFREPDNKFDRYAIEVKAKIFSSEYKRISCLDCGAEFEDDGEVVECPKCESGDIFPGKLAKIGYIRNRGIQCIMCGYEDNVKAGVEIPTTCPMCATDTIIRGGLATELSKAMDDGVKYACEVLEYTGGAEGKQTMGVNIRIVNLKK
jgi:predicted Zn-ribbon and HTH transcriptional regulator